jgi:hypothetical protein
VLVSNIKIYPLNLTGGKTYRLALNVPPRGTIYKAQVVDYSKLPPINGTNDGFTSTFFNSTVACPPDPIVGGVPTPPATPPVVNAWDEDAAQITHVLTANSGEDRYLNNGIDGGFSPVGIPYANADGGSSAAQGKLYLMLTVAGTGPKTFGVFLQIGSGNTGS